MSNIFGNEIPALRDNSDGNPYTLGTRFGVTQPGTISHIRWYVPFTLQTDQAGVGTNITIALFDESWGLMSQRSVSTVGFEDTWHEFELDAPVNVAPGQSYTAAIFTPWRYVATSNYAWPKTSPDGYLSTTAPGGFFNGEWSLTYPDQTFSNGCYFIDVRFNLTSAPTGPTVSIWNGTQELAASARLWDGSTERTATIEFAP